MKSKIKKLLPIGILMTGLGIAGLSIGSGFKHENIKTDFLTKIISGIKNLHKERPQERVYLHLDKSFYKPGESIWFKAYIRNGKDMMPSTTSDILHVELINPKGTVEKHIQLISQKGLANGDFHLEESAPGGLYKIKAYTQWQLNEESSLLFEKEVQVQNVILPNVLMKLNFNKKAYGANDMVSATIEFKTLENKAIASKDIKYKVQLEGENYLEEKSKTDENGNASIAFRLPKILNSNDGLLNILIEHDGKTESISRSIPIELNTIDLTFFPEGGDLLAGYSSKVAFKALNSYQKPADVEGYLTDADGNKVATFCSYHQGMGAFYFKPKDGENYIAHITKPSGITTTYKVPEASSRGYLLGLSEIKKDQVTLELSSTEKEVVTVVGTIRDNIVYTEKSTLNASTSKLVINTSDFPMGVIRFTLFDGKGIERAERLAFVNRDKKLSINLTTDKEKYLPRERVKLSVKVCDEKGIPVQGNFSLSVADEKLLSFADDKSANILSKLFLENDIKEKIEESSFYFDPKEAKAETAMDYLMLTSGWRRFTWKEIIENELPGLSYKAEKAILAGRVVDGYENKGLSKVTVEISGKNIQTKTDTNGYFKLPFVDLSEAVTLMIKAEGYSSYSMPLYEYNSELTCALYPQRYVKYYAPDAKMGMAERGGAVKRKADMNKDMAVELEAPMAAPVMNQDKAIPELVEFKLEKKEVFENNFDEDAFEPLENAKKAMPRPQVQVSKYYRARQFPSTNYNSSSNPEIRTDFRSTIYWNGNVTTDRTGRATIEFYNSDEISSFRAVMEGFSEEGLAGRKEALYYTQLPFSMAIKCPAELISGDVVKIPLTLKNNTSTTITGDLTMELPNQIKIHQSFDNRITINPGAVKNLVLECVVTNKIGKDKLRISFKGAGFTDAFEQIINVMAKGFPLALSLSGKEKEKEYEVNVSNLVAGSMDAKFTAYPTMMSDLLKGIESIIREPYGCFEQTSTSNYPNVLIKRYLQEMNEGSEAGIKKFNTPANLDANLEKGYARLTSYETKEKGYEWFGGTPAHEALTAYGLMQFNDMKVVYDKVDQTMIDRTANWLMSRRDGDGGFKKSAQALDQFGRATEDITNAYITYAMSEAGYKDIRKEANKSFDKAIISKDPYQLALVANTMFNLNEINKAEKAINVLENIQDKDGSWTGLIHSITCSTGKSLSVETTSLAVMALLKEKPAKENKINEAIKYLVGSRSAYGGFGSTQGTVLALKALTAYSIHSKRVAEDGSISIFIDGKKVATREYKAGDTGELVIENLAPYLNEGKHRIKIKYSDVKEALPFTFGITYHTSLPQSSKDCKVKLETQLNSNSVSTGETARLNITLTNVTNEGLPMTMGIIGIPSGLSPQPWQLKELIEKKQVDFYEVRGNKLFLYFRQMEPKEIKKIALDLKAEVSGEYEAPASSAYLYYTEEFKFWTQSEKIIID